MESIYGNQPPQDTSYRQDAPLSQPSSSIVSKLQATIIIILLCVVIGLMCWHTFSVSRQLDQNLQTGLGRIEAKINAPVEWEYRIEAIPDTSFSQTINEMGKEGWELVFARRASDGATYSPTFSYEIIFKRPKRAGSAPVEKSTPNNKQK